MVVLVLGATGMLGHKLMQVLADRFEVHGTVRGPAERFARHPVLGAMSLVGGVEADDLDSILAAAERVRPEAVINCIGVIKQLPAAKAPIPSLRLNALFPHRLAQLCRATAARMIHISTDCVFSGRKGDYVEADLSDAEDLYGRSKFLGEVTGPGALTLRTSIIGRELEGRSGLVEWFLSRKGGEANGYARAIYSGFTTEVLARVIGDVLERHPRMEGLWHVSSEPINKYDLLGLVNRQLDLGIALGRDETFVCDRSLNSARFRAETGFEPPPWPEMIRRFAADPTPYRH
jgi:dTDP-4-dehydrorhamnose reductase